MQKIKTVFMIVVSMAVGWNLKGFVVAVKNRAHNIQTTQDAKPAEPTTHFTVSKTAVSTKTADLDQLFTQIRIVPFFEDSQAAGMKILSVASGSLFDELGFKRGDIVRKINDQLVSMENGMLLFQNLKTTKQIDVLIERGSDEQLFRYEIQD